MALLALFVQEPPRSFKSRQIRPKIRWQEILSFSSTFWAVAGIGAVFTLARFSEAFPVLRAADLGLGKEYVPLVMVVMNLLYATSA